MTGLEKRSDEDLEALVERALDAFENDGEAGLARLYDASPESADALRARVEALRAVGLLGARPSSTPERLGGFKLLRPLGAGGMGIVYLALQEELGREVALKLIRPEHLFFPGARKRFRREVEIVARLQHPGIVPIHTVGEEHGIPYFAMELLRGETLEASLARLQGREPASLVGRDLAGESEDPGYLFAGSWEEACLRVVRQVAEALDHAHRQGVLHRDIKPSNVLVTSGSSSRAVLLDFGLAASRESGKLTRSGEQLGSLNYMAPEQVRGARELDPRSDVYALGATLYELLTLRPAFGGSLDTEVLRAIELGSPRRIRELNPRISWEAETVCMAAMEHDAARRYASAADFARDIDNVIGRRPIEARRAGTWHRAKRWIGRNPALAAALAVVLLLAIGAPSVYAWQQHRSALAVGEQRDHAERNFERALAAVDRMLSRVGDVDLRFVPQMEPVRAAVLTDAIELLQQFVADEGRDPRATRAIARAHTRLADLYVDLGRNAEAADEFSRAVEAYSRLRAADPDDADARRQELVMRAQRAYVLSESGRGEEALKEHAALEVELERALADAPGDLPLRFQALTNIEAHGHALENVGRGRESRALYERSAREANELVDAHARDLGVLKAAYSANNTLSVYLLAITKDGEDTSDIERALERAIACAEQLVALEPQDPQPALWLATARGNLAGAYRRSQQWDRALDEYEAARAGMEELVARFPSTPSYKLELATLSNQLGLLREVHAGDEDFEPLYQRAVDLLGELVVLAPREASLWDRYGSVQANLSSPFAHRDEFERAQQLLLDALDAHRRAIALAPDNVQYRAGLVRTASYLSILRRDHGDHVGAAAIVEAIAREVEQDWIAWSNAAVQLAKLVQWVRDVGDFEDGERQRLIDDYAARAVVMIEGAVAHGVPGTRELHELNDLRPLFGLEVFERYAKELSQVKE